MTTWGCLFPGGPQGTPSEKEIAVGTPGNWMRTYSGHKFYPFEPERCIYTMQDIAHGLALKCRYAGQSRVFYSVAEHSVRVSWLVGSLGGSPSDVLWGLMHDAVEAYMFDLPAPMKLSELGRMYKELEAKHLKQMCECMMLDENEPAIVKQADRILLFTEKRDLMQDSTSWKGETDYPPLTQVITPWTWQDSERVFLDAYYEAYKNFSR